MGLLPRVETREPLLDEAAARKWKKRRRWGPGVHCIPNISLLFLLFCLCGYFILGRDWVRLVGQLRGYFVLASVIGVVYSLLDWRKKERRYGEYLARSDRDSGPSQT